MTNIGDVIVRLLASPYEHELKRNGELYVTTLRVGPGKEVMIVAPTFDESATRALDIADDMARGGFR